MSKPFRTSPAYFLPLFERLQLQAEVNPGHPVILSPEGEAVNYRMLFETAKATTAVLRAIGMDHRNRIAVVLPNGPELATALISVASGAVCVPLNIKLSDDDWHRHLLELRVDGLLTISGAAPTAVRAAHELRIEVLEAHSLQEVRTGAIGSTGMIGSGHLDDMPALDEDAFVLPTSGTSAWPKSVPLTHANICHSMRNTGTSLDLSDRDVLLCPLPLHHAHGLISGLMATLGAGAGVVVMRSFSADAFFELMQRYKPTWYTAVPAIHQAIVEAADAQKDVIQDHTLRLIRSASSTLPQAVYSKLSDLFEVPILETYGMTEAASQIASNPLPPGIRKTGSVGLATGQEVAVLDSEGVPLPQGQEGEIALRGPNLSRGYDEVVPLRASPWKDGWFLTGDLGYFDDDGYIFIRGRIKEIINRGGEKVVPMKVEEKLLAHPCVSEAVVFSIPHERLGEDVAAAVVLRAGADLSAQDLRVFTLQSGGLRPSEAPKTLVFVDSIPKSATGKVQRSLLATKLGLTDTGRNSARLTGGSNALPQTATEIRLSEIWRNELGIKAIGCDDDFFELGCDSLTAVRVALNVQSDFGVQLSLREIFEAPNVSDLAELVEAKRSESTLDSLPSSEDRVAVPDKQECTAAQLGILQRSSLFPVLPVHNLPFAFILRGPLDVPSLNRSLQTLVQRHDALRMVFPMDETVSRFQVWPEASLELEAEDWSMIPSSNQRRFAARIAADEAWNSIDLQSAPSFRVRLLRFSSEHHVLIFTFHHINSDGGSMEMFFEELSQLYIDQMDGSVPRVGPPARQFSEFAREQRRWSESQQARDVVASWKVKLTDPPAIFQRSRDVHPDGPGFGTERTLVELPDGLFEKLDKLAKQESCTLFMVLLAGLKTALRLCYDAEDICVATPFANRADIRADTIFGLLENLVIIRTQATPDMSFRCVLHSVRDAVLNAHTTQAMPFEQLVVSLDEKERSLLEPALDVCMSMRRCFSQSFSIPTLEVTPLDDGETQGQPVLPMQQTRLMLTFIETTSGLKVSCIYREDTFDEAEVESFLTRFEKVLWRAVFEPEQPLSLIKKHVVSVVG